MTQNIKKMIVRNLEDTLTMVGSIQFGVSPDNNEITMLQNDIERLKIVNAGLTKRNIAMKETLESILPYMKVGSPVHNKIEALMEVAE